MKSAGFGMEQRDPLQVAWQRLVDHCHENGLVDVLLAVRAGYAEELRSERQARRAMVSDAVAVERERCAKICDAVAAEAGPRERYASDVPWEAESIGVIDGATDCAMRIRAET